MNGATKTSEFEKARLEVYGDRTCVEDDIMCPAQDMAAIITGERESN